MMLASLDPRGTRVSRGPYVAAVTALHACLADPR